MKLKPRRLALAAALTAVGVLSAASGAGAAVAPPAVTGNTLTVGSDDGGDAIAFAAAAGFITVNGAATTLAADTNAQIVVNAGGGNDTVDATALGATNYGAITINGGDGDDLLSGGANKDVVHGDGGEDRVLGFKGSDLLDGGEGNDVLVWNNGDGSDRDEGGAGTDEVEVNGSPTVGDQFVAGPEPAEAGVVLFKRTNLVEFEIESLAERLTVNGLGGTDQFTPDPAAPTGLAGLTGLTLNGGSGGDRLVGSDGGDQINGGSGADALGGGEGADQISGGDENDVIEGDGGDDRLVGGTGSDTLAGNSGDDAIVWNNGDGSDPVNEGGPGFDTVEVNGSPTAADLTKLTADSLGATFQRTNLVPFTLQLGAGDEAVAFNGAGGNDAIAVTQDGTRILVVANGGAGNDELSGGNEADSFFGGSGDDLLNGGGGSDLLDGGEGGDRLLARDGVGDLVRGGAGEDSAQTDRITVDAVDGVETLEATPAPVPAPDPKPVRDRTAMLPTLGKVAVVRSHGRLIAHAPVSCPVAEAGGCRTVLTLRTAMAVKLGRSRSVLVLGSAKANLAEGQRKTVSIPLNPAAVGLAHNGRLATQVRVSSSDGAGNSAAAVLHVGLRFPSH